MVIVFETEASLHSLEKEMLKPSEDFPLSEYWHVVE